jgi:hypothetical protein
MQRSRCVLPRAFFSSLSATRAAASMSSAFSSNGFLRLISRVYYKHTLLIMLKKAKHQLSYTQEFGELFAHFHGILWISFESL